MDEILNDLVEVTIELDPEIKKEIISYQKLTGVTDSEIFALGLFRSCLKDVSLEEALKYLTLDQYMFILDYCKMGLDKIEAYSKSQT